MYYAISKSNELIASLEPITEPVKCGPVINPLLLSSDNDVLSSTDNMVKVLLLNCELTAVAEFMIEANKYIHGEKESVVFELNKMISPLMVYSRSTMPATLIIDKNKTRLIIDPYQEIMFSDNDMEEHQNKMLVLGQIHQLIHKRKKEKQPVTLHELALAMQFKVFINE